MKFFKPEHTTDKNEQVDMPALAIGLLADCQKDLDHAKGVLLDATTSPYGQNWVKCSRKRRCQSMPQCLSFMLKIPQNSEYHSLCTEARTLLLFFLKCSSLLWGGINKNYVHGVRFSIAGIWYLAIILNSASFEFTRDVLILPFYLFLACTGVLGLPFLLPSGSTPCILSLLTFLSVPHFHEGC